MLTTYGERQGLTLFVVHLQHRGTALSNHQWRDIRPMRKRLLLTAHVLVRHFDALRQILVNRSRCAFGKLVYPPVPQGPTSYTITRPSPTNTVSASPSSSSSTTVPATCSSTPETLHLSDPPYENYFYSNCHSSNQVVVTSPLSDSNLTIIGPRLLVWDLNYRQV